MTNTETDKDNSAVAKFLNNNICVAGHPTLRPCTPCTSCQAVPGPGGSHPDQESSSHQQLSPGHAVHAAAPLRPSSVQPVPGLAAGIADCSRRSQLSSDCSFAPGQHPTPTRHASTQSDHTSSKVTASQCNKYGSMGAHIPSQVEPAIVTVVGPCEGGRPGGAAQSTALDHHPGVGLGRCEGELSRVHLDSCPQHFIEVATLSHIVKHL